MQVGQFAYCHQKLLKKLLKTFYSVAQDVVKGHESNYLLDKTGRKAPSGVHTLLIKTKKASSVTLPNSFLQYRKESLVD